MQTAEYLERINYASPVTADRDTLRRLHVAHLTSVPFENLSIHWGEPIVLATEALFDKIVRRRRGGFCYELNGLFAWLLRRIGFDVEMLSAGVADKAGNFGPPFDHMTLAVRCGGGPYLADVGFGDLFREPLRLDERAEQNEGAQAYRIADEGHDLTLHRRTESGAWAPQYRFGLEPYAIEAFETMCRYQQTSPDSHFTQERVCSLATADGRVTIGGRRLITTTESGRHERELQDDAEIAGVLRDIFGISPPSPQ